MILCWRLKWGKKNIKKYKCGSLQTYLCLNNSQWLIFYLSDLKFSVALLQSFPSCSLREEFVSSDPQGVRSKILFHYNHNLHFEKFPKLFQVGFISKDQKLKTKILIFEYFELHTTCLPFFDTQHSIYEIFSFPYFVCRGVPGGLNTQYNTNKLMISKNYFN